MDDWKYEKMIEAIHELDHHGGNPRNVWETLRFRKAYNQLSALKTDDWIKFFIRYKHEVEGEIRQLKGEVLEFIDDEL